MPKVLTLDFRLQTLELRLRPGVELLAVFLTQGTAVGEDILVGHALHDLVGRVDPLFLELVGLSTKGLVVKLMP